MGGRDGGGVEGDLEGWKKGGREGETINVDSEVVEEREGRE